MRIAEFLLLCLDRLLRLIKAIVRYFPLQTLLPGRSRTRQSNEQITPPHTPTSGHVAPRISVPEGPEYEAKVRACQDYIAAGDSYELCLTDQTLIARAWTSSLSAGILRERYSSLFIVTPSGSWHNWYGP